jgi:hypothetical protein
VTPPKDEWTVPPPPGGKKIRGRWVTAGIAVALAAHVLTLFVASAPHFVNPDQPINFTWLLIAQAVLLLAFIAATIALFAKDQQGWGLGVIIGWAVGLIVVPDIGIAACINALNSGTGVG